MIHLIIKCDELRGLVFAKEHIMINFNPNDIYKILESCTNCLENNNINHNHHDSPIENMLPVLFAGLATSVIWGYTAYKINKVINRFQTCLIAPLLLDQQPAAEPMLPVLTVPRPVPNSRQRMK